MSDMDNDTAMRLAAFAHIRRLIELRDGLTAIIEYAFMRDRSEPDRDMK
jgi:hypothetical protein